MKTLQQIGLRYGRIDSRSLGWGVITDKYEGLRKMADQVNEKVSRLYRENLGTTANIVSVDFYRGTTIVDLAIYFNYKKVIS